MKSPTLSFLAFLCLLVGSSAFAQAGNQPANPFNSRKSTTPKLHYDFPFQTMWDDAVLTSVHSGKPTLAFDLDLVDSASIRLANEIIRNKPLQKFIRQHFEAAMNDFATDPPPSVGLDSLRNLGWRLSGLEKDYIIPFRPTIIIIDTNKEELERIVHPENMSAKELEARLKDILKGKNTMRSLSADFWRDTTSIEKRQRLIAMFEAHSKYDSVMYHLEVLRHMPQTHEQSIATALRYVDLKLHVEGNVRPLDSLMATLGTHGADSVLHFNLLTWKLQYYQGGKRVDSVTAVFHEMLAFTGTRDPELLNELAWHLASYDRSLDTAMSLITEAMSHDKHNPNFYDTRAFIYYRENNLNEAIASEEEALRYAKADARSSADDRKYFQDELAHYRDLKTRAEQTEKKP